MHATSRDIVVFALVISLVGTFSLALSVLFRFDVGISEQTMAALAGAGMLAFLYSAIAALEVAGRRAILQVAVAALVAVPVTVIAAALI